MQQIYRKIQQRIFSTDLMKGLLKSIFYLLLGLSVLVLTLQLPLSEESAYLFRHGYNLWLLGAAFLLYVGFTIPGVAGRLISYCLVLILFTLPLTALWRQGYAEMQMIGGVLPFSDSAQYYHNASRLVEGFSFTPFGTRHPFAPALMASLLVFTGHHLMRTTAILVFMNAISVFLTAKILRKSQHAVVASVFVMLSYLFYRRFIGMTDTENLGFLFGMLGFDLLFIGACTRKTSIVFSGVLITALGLNARPGAFFVLPALLVWFVIYFRQKFDNRRASRIIFLAVVMLIPFLLNLTLAACLGSGKAGLFSNYAYTLYGISVGGSGWEEIYHERPEIRGLSENEAAQLALQLAVENIRTDPGAVIRAVQAAYLDFFSLKNRSAFGYVSGGDLTVFNQLDPDHLLVYKITRAILWFFSLLGLIWLWRHKQHPELGLMLGGLAGILLSIPFLPPRDAAIMRIYAATISFLFLLPAFGLKWLFSHGSEKPKNQEEELHTAAIASTIAIVLVTLVILGSLSLRLFKKPARTVEPTCSSGEYATVLRIPNGSYLHVQSDLQAKFTQMPVIGHTKFIKNLRQFPNAEKVEELTSLSAPYLILNTVNLLNGEMLWAVAPSQAVEDLNQPLAVCGHWMPELLDNGLGFLHIDTYTTME